MKRIYIWLAGLVVSLLPGMVLATLVTLPPATESRNVWTFLGPEGGTIESISIDPRDSNTIYVGTNVDSFKSADGGRSWSKSNIPLYRFPVFDPQNPNILYALYRPLVAGDLLKSTDGGTNWVDSSPPPLPGPRSCSSVSDFVMNPQNPSTVFVASLCGVFKSINGAISWRSVNLGLPSLYVQTLVIDPRNPTTLYAGTHAGLYKSTDGGETWRVIREGTTRFAIAVDPVNPGTVYAAPVDGGVFKSTDGGESWSAANSGPKAFVFRIVVDPENPNTIYAGGGIAQLPGALFRSTDAGESWVDTGLKDILSFALDPHHSQTVYVGTVDGAFKSVDGARSWSPFNSELRGVAARVLAVDPQNASVVYAQIAGHPFKSIDGGTSWIPISGLNRLNAVAIDPQNSRTIFAGGDDGVFKSTDGGESWVYSFWLPVGALAIDPKNSDVIYMGSAESSRVFKSIDGGSTWIAPDVALLEIEPGTGIIICPQTISFLAIDPQNPSRVYAATSDCNDQGGSLWRSRDGGTTWHQGGYLYVAAWPLGDGYATPITVDPSGTLYVNGGSSVFKSRDGGETWSVLTRRPLLSAMATDSQHPGTLYAAFWAQGVFKSIDGGTNWINLNEGLSNLNIQTLVLSGSPPTLYAGTTGGIFKIVDEYPRVDVSAPKLSLDGARSALGAGMYFYCLGGSWNLNITGAPPNASIRLSGTSNGRPWAIPDWRRTDANGNFSEADPFVLTNGYGDTLEVEIGGLVSNTVSFSVSACVYLSLDAAQYCTGNSWKLQLAGATPNASVDLFGTLNGRPLQVLNWSRTGSDGNLTESGTFSEESVGANTLRARAASWISNDVKFTVSRCGP